MANDSTTGGVLAPAVATPPEEDADLDAIVQTLVVAITGLDGSLVRPRWQAVVPKQPEPGTNWCAIGVMASTSDAGPFIAHVSAGAGSDSFIDHEQLDVLATFYGPLAMRFAAILRDGLKVPQNTEGLGAVQIRFIDCGPIRTVPELVNQQWIHRQDIAVTLRRKVTRVYPVENLLIGDINLIDDTGSDDVIVVTPGSIVEP